MKFYYLIHTMLAQKGANIIKILSVAVGLLVSCLIFSTLAFFYGYDTCYHDYKRLYAVQTKWTYGNKEEGPHLGGNGALAGAIVEEFPDDVAATSFYLVHNESLEADGRTLEETIAMGDSVMFETMGLELLSGYPRRDLTMPSTAYISKSLAEELYGEDDPIGKQLKYKDILFTVRGVYKDLPENISMSVYRIIMSYPSIAVLGMDERMAWTDIGGSDVFIRLLPGSKLTPEVLASKLNEIQERNCPSGERPIKLDFSVTRVDKVWLCNENITRTLTVLWILGGMLLSLTTFNYALITIASLSRRAKSIGVHKCSGASGWGIVGMFLSETLLILAISFLVMVGLLFLFQPFLDTVGTLSVQRVYAPELLWVSLCVGLFFFIVGGLLPGYLFSRIPVTQVFTRFTDRNSAWKKNLLFIQLTGVAFISGLLVVLSSQYREVVNRDMGFNMKGAATFSLHMVSVKRDVFESTLRSLPYVEGVCAGNGVPMIGRAFTMMQQDNGEPGINVSQMSFSPGFLDMMGFRLLEGRIPERDDEVLVNETFVREMHFGDSVVGRKLLGGRLTVTGLLHDYAQWGFFAEIEPAIIKPIDSESAYTWFVKLSEPFDENYEKLNAFINETFPSEEWYVRKTDEVIERFYSELHSYATLLCLRQFHWC